MFSFSFIFCFFSDFCFSFFHSDDVRRSIDVLDQVLSEFDDIEPFVGDDDCSQVDLGEESGPAGDQEVPEDPPPIDRSLKPKISPPTLPQKSKKKPNKTEQNVPENSSSAKSPLDNHQSFVNHHRSLDSRRSEVSSHDYQEINSDLCPSPCRRKSACSERDKGILPGHPQRQRRRSNKECYSSRMNEIDYVPRMAHQRGFENPLRKSRSGDVSLGTEDPQLVRGRKNGRRSSHQKRGRSSDRFLDYHYHSQPHFDSRRLSEEVPIDPRVIHPNFLEQRGYDPRLYDPRLVDPRYIDPTRFMCQKGSNQKVDPRFLDTKFGDPNLCDPRFVDPAFLDPPPFVDDPLMIPFEGPGRRHTAEDSVQFPHLMAPHVGMPSPYSLPPASTIDFHPHTIPPYDYPPLPDSIVGPDYPYPPPHFDVLPPQVNGFDPGLQNIDPSLAPLPSITPGRGHHQRYPIGGLLELPFSCPPDVLPVGFSTRERLSFDGGGGGRSYPYSRDPRLGGDSGWMPPTPEEARKAIQRLVR